MSFLTELFKYSSRQRKLLKLLRSIDPETRGCAAIEIGKMGDGGTFAVVELIRLLDDWDWIVRANSAAALGEIGGSAAKAAVPALKNLLNVKTRDHRTGAIWAHFALARIEGDLENHVDAIFEELEVIDVDIASAAANALGRLGPVADIVPRLIQRAKIRSGAAEAACFTLGLMGPGACEAIPVLKQCLKDNNFPHVKSAAREALSRIEHS